MWRKRSAFITNITSRRRRRRRRTNRSVTSTIGGGEEKCWLCGGDGDGDPSTGNEFWERAKESSRTMKWVQLSVREHPNLKTTHNRTRVSKDVVRLSSIDSIFCPKNSNKKNTINYYYFYYIVMDSVKRIAHYRTQVSLLRSSLAYYRCKWWSPKYLVLTTKQLFRIFNLLIVWCITVMSIELLSFFFFVFGQP